MAEFQPAPTWAEVVLVDEQTGKFSFNPIWLNWFLALTELINDAGGGGGAFVHNSLSSIQGGSATERYHLTSAQYTLVITFTDPLRLGAGSKTAPTYSFSADTNTGMYSLGSDVLAFTSGGVDAWYIAGDTLYGGSAGSGTTAGAGRIISGQEGGGTGGAGGKLTVTGGQTINVGYDGGELDLEGGAALGGIGIGGTLKIRGGGSSGTGVAGDIQFFGGNSTGSGNGGAVTFRGGTSSSGTAGNMTWTDKDGGNVLRVNSTTKHYSAMGTSPTITAGGGASPSIAGKDQAFTVTVGTGGVATTFTVTFANAFTNAPPAVAVSDTDIVALKVATTTTTVIVTATAPFTASSKVHVVVGSWE